MGGASLPGRAAALAMAALLLCALAAGAPARAGDEAGGEAAGPSVAAAEGDAAAAARLDRAGAGLGERLRLRLTLEGPAGAIARFSDVGEGLDGLRVVGTEDGAPLRLSAERRRWLRVVVLEAERAGPARIEGLEAHLLGAGGGEAVRTLRLPPLALEIATVLAPDADLSKPRGPGPPVSLPEPEGFPVALAIAAALALLAAGGVLAVLRHRRRGAGAAAAAGGGTDAPADRAALDALAGLSVAPGMSEREVEALYEAVAEILRRYLARGFGLDAPRRTTEEVLAAAGRAAPPVSARAPALKALLAGCDLVKFARARPGAEAARRMLAGAAEFVAATARAAAPEPEGGAGA